MVMHRVVQNLVSAGNTQILDRIDGVILLADGDRLRNDNVTAWGSAPGYSQGIGQLARAVSGSRSQKLPQGLESRVHSICFDHDFVCASGSASALWDVITGGAVDPIIRGLKVHGSYKGGDDVSAATDAVLRRVRGRL
jgi:hypothetical protein